MKKRKIIAVLLGIVCSMSLLACGNVGENVLTENDIETSNVVENEISIDSINVKDYYSVTQEGYDAEYYFDTSVFNPDLFDGKWIFETAEVTLPLGSIKEIQELGIDVGRDNYMHSDEDLFVNTKFRDPMIEADSESIIDMCWGYIPEDVDGELSLDDYVDDVITGYAYFVNNTDTEIHILEADIDFFSISVNDDDDAVDFASVFGMECASSEMLNVDTIVEHFGLPIYYEESGAWDELDLFYYYGDYSIIFTFKLNGENTGILKGMEYVTWKYMECHTPYDEGSWYEYMKVCEEYN